MQEKNLLSSLFAGKLITLEAMSGLSKVLLHLDKKNVHLLVVYIFMKIKPFLESVSFASSALASYFLPEDLIRSQKLHDSNLVCFAATVVEIFY